MNNKCLTVAEDLIKEFDWLKDLIVDTMMERMEKLQVCRMYKHNLDKSIHHISK